MILPLTSSIIVACLSGAVLLIPRIRRLRQEAASCVRRLGVLVVWVMGALPRATQWWWRRPALISVVHGLRRHRVESCELARRGGLSQRGLLCKVVGRTMPVPIRSKPHAAVEGARRGTCNAAGCPTLPRSRRGACGELNRRAGRPSGLPLLRYVPCEAGDNGRDSGRDAGGGRRGRTELIVHGSTA